MLFRQLFDPETSTYTYLLADERTREAVLIDPVLEQVERDLQVLRELDLTLRWAVDTHVHADHVTGLGTLRQLAYPKKIDVALPANLHCGVPQGIHATPDALTTPPKSAP